MKYYTDELWSKMNSDSFEKQHEADIDWDSNRTAYREQIKTLENRLSKKVYDHHINKGFHDYRLHDFKIIHGKVGFKDTIKVEIVLLDYDEFWKITYTSVTKIQVNYACQDERRGFDDFGYEEILSVDEDTLSHEILFASGAIILVHFKNKKMSITKLKKDFLKTRSESKEIEG